MKIFEEGFEVIDLGVYMDEAAIPPWGYKAKHVTHTQGAKAMANYFNGLEFRKDEPRVDPDVFPEALGLAWTQVETSDHAGNHIDAPWHFGPTCEGQPAKTIDRVPLDWCCGPGVRFDFRHKAGTDISVADLEGELARIGGTITAGTIPLLWTGADEHIATFDKYWPGQAGLSPEGLHWFLDRGVKLIGIDAYALDVSYASMNKQRGDGDSQYFPLHFIGRQREHMHLEKLAGLGRLPRPTGFMFMAFPIKLRGASAGWVRPVALVPRDHFDGSKTSEETK